MSTWQIVRGVKTNRVRRESTKAARGWRVERGVKTNRVRGKHKRKRDAFDASPQRAKLLRQRSGSSSELWTVISISVRVTDLLAVDQIAERLGMSRSMLLVEAAKKLA